ncbi:2,3-butanediol dehydrogenase [Oenococcus alcoholitolerans]|uniref:2,3-butanediol dehydrogenase n=1 Tax=Oenococcus alcoholitolerans TaxID=931074 RepID=UPI003F714541
MKAARIYGAKDIRIEDVDIPDPEDDQVQIKVKYCGICGSDLHAYLQGWGLPKEPHPITGRTLPITLGHEFSGQVVKLGKNVSNLKIGDKVAIEPVIACGECENCRKGQYNLCIKAQAKDGAGNFLGFSQDGGFAEYANVKSVFAHKLPAGMNYEIGALAEPTAVVYEALKRSRLRAGQDVAIMGAGPIGLLMALLARIAGANHIFIVDLSEVRLHKAEELGFINTINPGKEDAAETIKGVLPNGVDIAYEAAGVQATFDTALKVTKRGGTLQIVALFGRPITFDMTKDLIMQGINIITTICYNNSFPQVLGILNNNKDLFDKIITKKISLDQLVDQGIKEISADKQQVKILVSAED